MIYQKKLMNSFLNHAEDLLNDKLRRARTKAIEKTREKCLYLTCLPCLLVIASSTVLAALDVF